MAWFAFDIEDYDADTMHLSAAEDGMYMRLLRFYYKTRIPLPDDDRALAAIARVSMEEWEGSKHTLRAFFKPRRGRLHHKRCNKELDREDSLSRKRSERAKNAIEKRWAKSKTSVLPVLPPNARSTDTVILGDTTRPDQTIHKKKEESSTLPKKPLEIDDEMLAWATKHAPSVNVAEQLSAHLDWKKATGRRYKDDRAGFRTWLRKAQSDAARQSSRQNGFALAPRDVSAIPKPDAPRSPAPKLPEGWDRHLRNQ